MASRLGRPAGLLQRSIAAPGGAHRRIGAGPQALLPLGLGVTAMAVGVMAGVDPKFAIAAAFGLSFAGLVLTNLTVGLCLFVVVSFLEVLSSIGSFGITKMTGFLLAISWLAYVTTRREEDGDFISSHPGMTYLLALFVAWSALGMVWAEFPGDVFQSTFRYAQNALLFLIVFTAVRERRHAVWVIAAFVTGAAISAMFAVMNPVDPGQYDVARSSGTLGDPNELAAVLVVGMIFAGVLFAIVRSQPVFRLASLGALVLCAGGLLFTLSRGGLLALAFALLAGIFLMGRWRLAILTATVIAVVGTVGYFAVVAPPEARERVTEVDGGTGRTDIWTVGWRMVEAEPLHGVGSGNFQLAAIHYFLEPGVLEYGEFFIDHPKVAHNMYLHVLAENGIFGLAIFLSLLAFSLVSLVKAARAFERERDVDMELLTRGVVIALFGLLAADFFLSGQFSKQLWLLLGLGPALLAVARTKARAGRLSSF